MQQFVLQQTLSRLFQYSPLLNIKRYLPRLHNFTVVNNSKKFDKTVNKSFITAATAIEIFATNGRM